MGFVKVVKNKAYFKRYQVKYRRRREGLTDYKARQKLIVQDKNKYNSPKYRLVVRKTNRDIVCQIVHAKVVGDFVMTAAYAHELPRYGISVGLTNWAAAYATGLLLARRHLKKLNLHEKYAGVAAADGKMFKVQPMDDGPRPFYALLDVGLVRTSTGARVFGAMKGAVDGGLNVPHSGRRFPGYNPETKKLNEKEVRKYIFGGHVSDYMKRLSEDAPEKYKRQFAAFLKAKVTPDTLESMYKNAHKKIRENPDAVITTKKVPETKKRYNPVKKTYAERRNRVSQLKANFRERMAKLAEEDDE